MKLSDFLKNEVDGLSEKLVLEAAEADSEGNRMIMIRGTKFDTFKNIVSIAACAVLVVAIAVAALIMPGTLTSDTTPGDSAGEETDAETEFTPETLQNGTQLKTGEGVLTSADGLYNYYLKDEKAVIIRYLGNKENITIPETVDGYAVEVIEGYVENNGTVEKQPEDLADKSAVIGMLNGTTVKSIIIPESVTVGDAALRGSDKIESVTVESNSRSIGLYAFSGCTNLTSMTLSEGVQSIHPCAFEGCVSLAEITIPASVLDVGTRSFANCTSLEKVTFLSENHVIAKNAFEGTPWAENN